MFYPSCTSISGILPDVKCYGRKSNGQSRVYTWKAMAARFGKIFVNLKLSTLLSHYTTNYYWQIPSPGFPSFWLAGQQRLGYLDKASRNIILLLNMTENNYFNLKTELFLTVSSLRHCNICKKSQTWSTFKAFCWKSLF